MTSQSLDAVVVGAGPNGLTAAVTMAAAGLGVRVYEGALVAGGGARTSELTLPGFWHDLCSAVHPFAAGSPVFRRLPLAEHGLEWLQPEVPLAHPLPDGSAAVLARSVHDTVAGLGGGGSRYRALVRPFVGRWGDLVADVMQPFGSAVPRHPLLLARFGSRALLPVAATARAVGGGPAGALLAGMAGHTGSVLSAPVTAGAALMLALAGHDVGWPVPRGGSQAITDALVACLGALGGELETGHPVGRLSELPPARAYLLDTSAWALGELAGDRLPSGYLRRVGRFRRGPGVFKLDYALSGPVPWTAEVCRRAGTVHVGGPIEEIAAAMRGVAAGVAPDRPLVIAAQPSVMDPTRAPDGQHTLWAYAHVPNGWRGDVTGAIEDQIERFAPGFRDLILARAAERPAELERRDPNMVGGDISSGAFDGRQALFRPLVSRAPYATPDPAVFLCSSATPPGPGVHGMCGYEAARLALARVFDRHEPRFAFPRLRER